MNTEKTLTPDAEEALGIIAGGGQFPKLIAQEAKKNGHPVYICGFKDNTDPGLANLCDDFSILHLGQLSKLIDFFKKNNVKKICFAGTINKPKALDIRPDWRAAKLLFRLKTKGDDVILRAILQEFEKDGFTPLCPAEFLPSLKTPLGNLTGFALTEQQENDIAFGVPIARQMGKFDIGQCLIVRQGMVMAIECLEGTDATIKRGGELGGYNCVAIKICKPGQDKRIDLPSIGLTTIENLVEHDYAVLAIEAENTLFFDRERCLDLARNHNLHIISFEPEQEL